MEKIEKDLFIKYFIKEVNRRLEKFLPEGKKPLGLMLESAHDIIQMDIDHIQRSMQRTKEDKNE